MYSQADDFFHRLVHPDHTQRITCNQSKHHSWITGETSVQPLTSYECMASFEHSQKFFNVQYHQCAAFLLLRWPNSFR